jgi:outer membrane protein assembly factor BamB
VTGAAAFVAGSVVVGIERPDGTGQVTAIGRWTHEMASAPRGGIAAADGLVFALGQDGTLVALASESGTTKWSRSLGDHSSRWSIGVPLVSEDRVYAGSAMSAHAFDLASGEEMWRCDLAPADWAASWSGLAWADGVVVLGAASDHLHLVAIDASSGVVRWRHAGRDITGTTVTPAVADDTVVMASAAGWLRGFSLEDGAKRWRAPLDDAWPVAMVVAGERLFVKSARGRLSAHDATDGSTQWTAGLGSGAVARRPYSRSPGGSRVPVLALGGDVWTGVSSTLVRIDAATGSVVDRTDARAEIATLAVDDGRVLAITVDGATVAS